jgi:hypothetical protein
MPTYPKPFVSLLRPAGAPKLGVREVRREIESLADSIRALVSYALESGPAESAAERIDYLAISNFAEVASACLREVEEEQEAAKRAISPFGDRAWVEEVSAAAISASEVGFDPRGYFVYILRERECGWPIYIGQSGNVLGRIGEHLRAPDRRERIRHVSLIRCSSRGAMSRTERQLIAQYRPELNVAGVA